MYGPEAAEIMPDNTPNALLILLNVMKAAGSVDPQDVIDKFITLNEVETIFGVGPVCGASVHGTPRMVTSPSGVSVMDRNGNVSFKGYVDNYLP
jgi:hypothetical protein